MAMNFWEAQRKAKSRTWLYLMLFIALTIFVAICCELAMRAYYSNSNYDPPFPIVGLAFLGITFSVAGFNYLMYLQQGGSYVAETLGCHLVTLRNNDPKAKQLLNIVQEIAIASSLPVPQVYVIPADEINAFAAGTRSDNSIVAVSYGALKYLTRDELQGVVAHEFGHIYNGDMKISLRLAAMVMGFFFVLYFALRMLDVANITRSERSDNEGERKGNPLLIAALILLIAGGITYFFGVLLKFAVSRQREYLADACAVQFTRNPDGIANALRKIGNYKVSDMPKSGMAFSHMYIEDRTAFSGLFATHPPLAKRISAIEGRTWIPEEWEKDLPPMKK